VENIDIYALSLKLEKEDDIRNVASCLSLIAGANINVALRLNIDALASKFEKEEDIGNVGSCGYAIAMKSKASGTETAGKYWQ